MSELMRCGTCKHWGSHPADPQGAYRPCRAIVHGGEASSPNAEEYGANGTHEGVIAYTVDGSGYFAALKCREDFGCVLWQSKRLGATHNGPRPEFTAGCLVDASVFFPKPAGETGTE